MYKKAEDGLKYFDAVVGNPPYGGVGVKDITPAKADAEAEAIKERAAAEIAAARARATADLQAELGAKALEAAEAVVRENLDDAAQVDLVEAYINGVGTVRS